MTSLATLLALADSRLPTGGHVHSGGVEEAVTSGLVVDLATLRAFLRRRIRTHGLVPPTITTGTSSSGMSITLLAYVCAHGCARESLPRCRA